MTQEIGNQIGATIGIVKEVSVREDGIGWGSYFRVKIELDLRKLIARGRNANVLGNRIWVPLSYEKLPKLCFNCGRIMHGIEGCVGLEGNGSGSQYRTWLQAYHTSRGENTKKHSNTHRECMGENEGVYNSDNVQEEGLSNDNFTPTQADKGMDKRKRSRH